MSLLELLLLVGIVMVGYRILRGVLGPGIDVLEEGKRRAGGWAEDMREQPSQVKWPPGPRSAPRVVTRPAARDAGTSRAASASGGRSAPGSASTAASSPRAATIRSARATYKRGAPELDAWYLVLDVPTEATRGEIRDALKLRLSRARADRHSDREAISRIMRAAGEGFRQAGRERAGI